ncbi:MAG: hypothetical protein EOO51_02930 [Flavobacterium sp.]|nr:MAG: hypothetical protein EOO51_02930 [Flavobacterium sp.]
MLVSAAFKIENSLGLENLDLKNDQAAETRAKDNILSSLLTGQSTLVDVSEWKREEPEKKKVDAGAGPCVIVDVVFELDDSLTADYKNRALEIAQAAADAINTESWHVAHSTTKEGQQYIGLMSFQA